MEKYEIYRNGQYFGGFRQGQESHYWKPFDREIALVEFDDCVAFWKARGTNSKWELRIAIEREPMR